MSEPYIGEIRMFGFPRIPTGWLACDGSLQPISQYEALYTLLGTSYGGDGQTTFGLPDLRGSAPMHEGTGLGLTPRVIGQQLGTEEVTLTSQTTAQHNHSLLASQVQATTATPDPSQMLGALTGDVWYFSTQGSATAQTMATNSTSLVGGNQPHDNTMPTLTVSFCIAWTGVWPSQN